MIAAGLDGFGRRGSGVTTVSSDAFPRNDFWIVGKLDLIASECRDSTETKHFEGATRGTMPLPV